MSGVKPGQKLASAVCTAEVMVIKASADMEITCGGVAMSADAGEKNPDAADSNQMGGSQIGKRYVNEDQSLELLCVKAGEGSLGCGGEALVIKEAKKLPSSD